MNAEEVFEAIRNREESPFTPEEVLQAIHQDVSIFDYIWYRVDQGDLRLNSLFWYVDWVGIACLKLLQEGRGNEVKEFATRNCFGEFYFFAGWSLYRARDYAKASRAAEKAISYIPDNEAVPRLAALADDKGSHFKVPELGYENGRVVFPIELDAAMARVEVSDEWTT